MALGLFPALVLVRKARGTSRLASAGAVVLLLAGLILSGSRGGLARYARGGGRGPGRGARSRRGSGGRKAGVSSWVRGLALGVSVVAVAAWRRETWGSFSAGRAATLVDPGEALLAVRAGRVGFWKAGARMVAAAPAHGSRAGTGSRRAWTSSVTRTSRSGSTNLHELPPRGDRRERRRRRAARPLALRPPCSFLRRPDALGREPPSRRPKRPWLPGFSRSR